MLSSSTVVDTVLAAQDRGNRARPAVGGFPVLAEALRAAGVTQIRCIVPSMTTVYTTSAGAVVQQGVPLVSGAAAVAAFDVDALVVALRRDQAGDSTYAEFMDGAWAAGVVSYDVDLVGRTCTYHSAVDDRYVEHYPAVVVHDG